MPDPDSTGADGTDAEESRRVPDSTTDGLADVPRSNASRWVHRIGVTVLSVLVLAGAVGLLGPRTGEVAASGGGFDLEVEHTTITRAGVPAPLHLTITRADGFDGPVQVALCDSWFDHQDFQSWYPTPSSEVGERDRLVYEFDPPTGDTLEVSLDAHTAPGDFGGRDTCAVEVLEDDVPVTAVEFTTWRLP